MSAALRRVVASAGGIVVAVGMHGATASSAGASQHSATASSAGASQHSAEEQAEFDVYITRPTTSDLRPLVAQFQDGLEVWPWVWTWRNRDGPHHVFVGLNADTIPEIERLAKESPRNNIMIVAAPPPEEMHKLAPRKFYQDCQCGVIESEVALMDVKAKIMMLDDERIICFDRCTIAQQAEPGAPGTARDYF